MTAPAKDAGVVDAPLDVSRDAGPDAPVVPPIDASADASIDVRDASACPVDCSHLPNVLPGTFVPCVAGQCIVPYYSCVPGFNHCTANPNDGCETDLSRPENCGGCNVTCPFYAPSCASPNGYFSCVPICVAPFQACNYSCVDVSSDPNNCGSCNNYCFLPNAQSACQQGTCVVLSCYAPDYVDCTTAPGCETQLGTATACTRCGDPACSLDHTLLTCSSATNCAAAVCAPGWANCDATNPDCESSFATGGSCLPVYTGTVGLATLANGGDAVVVIGSDGSYFLGGEFSGTVDFDPTATMDIRTAVDANDGYITKFDARGNYLWTRTFAGRGNLRIEGLAAASGGAVVAVGSYSDTVDLDPGAAVDLHQTVSTFNQDPFVVKLGADGSLVWAKTFAGGVNGSSGDATGVTVDATDAVYVAGAFSAQIDLDPRPTTDMDGVNQQTGFVVKLNGSGTFVWSRALDSDPFCSNWVTGIAVGGDGSSWVTGYTGGNGVGCALTPAPDGGPVFQGADAFVIALGPGGELRSTWAFVGPSDDVANAIAIGTDGSIFVGGRSHGNVDFDPGPGVAERWVPNNGGFIVNLGADGTFRWAAILDDVPIASLAATSDGGVLATGDTSASFGQPAGAFVTKLNGNGSSAWTFTTGTDSSNARSVAVSSTGFAVAGTSSGSGDFNPGAGIDIVFGDVTFLSRYAF